MNRKRKIASIIVLEVLISQFTLSQIDSVQQRKFRVDFVVPDAPAFLLLDVDPSTILRPATVKEFAVAASDFVGNGHSLTIPQAIAIEVSPGLLVSGKTLSVSQYRQNDWWYRLRVSGATRRIEGSNGSMQAAIGIRTTIIDESDLRLDTTYDGQAAAITEAINDIYVSARCHSGPPPNPIVLTRQEQEQIDSMTLPLKNRWELKKWNARILDVAVGVLGGSPDSTGQNFRITGVAVWATYGDGFGTWGQWLLGGRLSKDRDSITDNFQWAGSLASRLYAGSNDYKGFFEIQFARTESEDPRWLFNGGGEAKLWKGSWVIFSAGLQYMQNIPKPTLVTNFKVNVNIDDLLNRER